MSTVRPLVFLVALSCTDPTGSNGLEDDTPLDPSFVDEQDDDSTSPPTGDTGTPGTTGTGLTDSGAVGSQVPADFDDVFVWETLTFGHATDMGHVPTALSAPAGAQPLSLVEVGVAAGLGNSRSGGASHGVGIGFLM